MKDVVALVTGGSRGIGRGIALALLAEGATVHVTGRTMTEAEARVHPQGSGSLEGLQVEAEPLLGNLVVYRCDHGVDAETEAVVEEVGRRGRLDILVNNAWPGYERMRGRRRVHLGSTLLAAADLALEFYDRRGPALSFCYLQVCSSDDGGP